MKLNIFSLFKPFLAGVMLLAAANVAVAAEKVEKVVEVSDTEKAQFEKDLEDRLARDIQSYLGNEHFILSVNAQLQKVIISEIETRTVAGESGQQGYNYKEEEINTREKIGSSSEQQASDFDIALPGLPAMPAGLAGSTSEQASVTGDKKVYEKKVSRQPAEASDEAGSVVQKVERIIEEKIKIKKQKLTLVLDENISAEQEQFVRSIVVQKAQVDEIRGDEIIVSKTAFPGAEEEVVTSNMTPLEALKAWVEAYWPWLIAALVLLFLLWLMNRGSNKDDSESVADIDLTTTASDLTLRDPEESAATAEVEAIKEQVVNIAVSDSDVAEEYVTSLSASSDEVEKTKLVVLYNAMGKSLFASLFKNVFTKADLDQISSLAREINENISMKDSAVYMQDAYKDLMKVYFEAQQQKDQGQQLRPFAFLKELDNAQIVYLISDEANKIKALVLSQLPADRAAEVIKALNEDEKNVVVAEMSRIRDVPLASLRSIASMLAKKARTAPSFDNVTVDGIDLIVDILERMDVASERDMLTSLEQDDPDLYHNIRQIYITFDDLPRLPTLALKNLVRDMERDQLALALYDAEEDFQTSLLEALPERPRMMARNMISNLSDIDEAAMQDAKRSMARKAREMLKAGLFDISELAEA